MKTTLALAVLSLVATAVATVALVQIAEGRKETAALKSSLAAVLNRPPPPPPPEPPVEVADVMTKLQRHANKLYFAGKHENWKLADFYIDESGLGVGVKVMTAMAWAYMLNHPPQATP